jgi:hypothetical protein
VDARAALEPLPAGERWAEREALERRVRDLGEVAGNRHSVTPAGHSADVERRLRSAPSISLVAAWTSLGASRSESSRRKQVALMAGGRPAPPPNRIQM